MTNDDFEALTAIGLTAPIRSQINALPANGGARPMRVTEVQRDRLRLHDGHAEHGARVPQVLADALAALDDALAVGDWVMAASDGAPSSAMLRVLERLEPQNRIARRVNDGRGAPRRQVLVTNVDTALLVMGLDHDFNLRRLERYLALARLAGVGAVLALTKADTLDDAAVQRRLEQARAVLPQGADTLACDGRDGGVRERLAPWLVRGRTLVLLGSSGAGKSTLTNTLCAAPLQYTGAARADDSRGRHTTTARTLHRTPEGACIVDTPGLRALRLDIGDESQLAEAFGDVARWAASCRFRDCRHQDEPGCAVRDALPQERVRNYHKLLREARRDTMTALERREQRSQWKARGREGQLRLRAKRDG